MDINDKFIADCQAEANRRKRSYPVDAEERDERAEPERMSPKSRAEAIIQEVEASKIRMLNTSGRHELNLNYGTATQHSSIVDENYMLIRMNIDSNLRDKIKKGEYVDFA